MEITLKLCGTAPDRIVLWFYEEEEVHAVTAASSFQP